MMPGMAGAHDIVVVGGGPVGAAAALGLARAGFRVALVERGARPPAFDAATYAARVYALSHASRRLLEHLGVWRNLVRTAPYEAMRVWVDAPTRGLAFSARQLALPELGWIVEHPLLVDRLWAALDYANVEVVAQAGTVAGSGGGGVTLEDGRLLEAPLVVAADGADSRLREAAGIQAVGWHYAQRGIVCNASTEKPHAGTAWQRFLKTGPLAVLPLADGRISIVWSADEARAQALLALDDAAFCAELSAAVQVLGAFHAPTPRLNFPLRLLQARRYAGDGLVLVGDAAHTVHPLAGQGVNLGFGDVARLCETLRQARDAGRDWSAPRTLQRYARARRADATEMLAVTDGLQKLFTPRTAVLRPLLGAGMAAVDALIPLKAWLGRQATL